MARTAASARRSRASRSRGRSPSVGRSPSPGPRARSVGRSPSPGPAARIQLSKEERALPAVAWPVVALAAAAAAVMAVTVTAAWRGRLSPLVSVPVAFVCVFCAFSPMHDGVHGSIFSNASGARWLNGVVGRAMAVMFLSPYVAFRYVHLQHHKDPDMWSSTGPNWLLPLKWALQEAHYYFVLLPILHTRPLREAVEIVLWFGATAALYWHFHATGQLGSFLLLWVLPAKAAAAFLAFAFDFLPHRPADPTTNPYHATSLIALRDGDDESTGALTLPLLWQNYHIIHHLWPHISFTRYASIYWSHRDELRARGVEVYGLWPVFVPRKSS